MLNNDSVTLEYKMTPGELLRYKSTVSSQQTIVEEGQAPEVMESVLELVMDQKVLELKNGIAKVEVTITDGSIRRGTEELPLDTVGQKLLMDMKRNGDVIKTSVNFPFSQPAFPEKPLLPGNSWQTVNPMNIPMGEDGRNKTVDLVYSHTLSRFDHQSGYDIAVIDIACPQVSFDLQDDVKQTIVADGCTNFAYKTGRLVSSRVHTHTEIAVPETKITTDINVTVELLEAQDNAASSPSLIAADEQFIIGI